MLLFSLGIEALKSLKMPTFGAKYKIIALGLQ